MGGITIDKIVSSVDYLTIHGDIMDFTQMEVTPTDIFYTDYVLNIAGLGLLVRNGRYAFAQALNCFEEPMMSMWSDGNYICDNTEFDGPVRMGSFNSIGKSGFGFENGLRLKHLGNVRIGKNVDIGSNTCIDRGVINSTVIGDNCKIDNLVHIAHNVVIGENTLIVAGSVIGGSTKIGKNNFIGINASIKNKVKLGDNVTVGMGAIVLSDVPDNTVVKGLWK